MDDNAVRDLCLELLHADTEERVIEILEGAGYWNKPDVWRWYGDRNGNFATIGNQQSRPEAALVEKLVNSVDARLMNACLEAEVDPASAEAPQSIRDAVALFFEGRKTDGEIGGTLREWASARRTEESHHITLASTGPRRHPCLTIADDGEGQTPDRMPDTFLSLDRDNKLRIPFVQGKFNMGGTGVLKFCGKHSLQLIITRRNPKIVSANGEEDPSSEFWGFTVVRRERPTQVAGAVRNSVYTYLAPLNSDAHPRQGDVLRFRASSLPAMPRFNEPYLRDIGWGSVIKLFDYDMKGFTSHILMKDGLLFRLEALLPEIALPVSLHECRDFGGKKAGSFVTPLSGLTVRLEEGRGGNLEDGYPDSVPFTVGGEKMLAKIYAFKKGKADTYRTNEGVIFTINGQTHGALPKSIFSRKSVKMGRLADSLLVTVDCSTISVDAREDLFMNSRDRLSSGELRKAVDRQLEEILYHHRGLRQLREYRRTSEVAERLADSKPLEEVLQSILKSSPSLASLFLTGHRLSQPHRRRPNGNGNGKHGGSEDGDDPFVGKSHPTFFRFAKRKDGQALQRDCELGKRCRLAFETDVENEYFSRARFPGHYDVEILDGTTEEAEINQSLTLHDGVANWSVELPDDLCVGDEITLQCIVSDDVLSEAFTNIATLRVKPASTRTSGNGKRKSRSGKGNQEGNEGNDPRGGKGKGADEPGGLQMPRIEKVHEDKWAEYKFDKHSACKIIEDEIEEEGEAESTYTFYINVDNIFLQTDMKQSKEDPTVVEAKFVYGNVLVGLALIQDDKQRSPRTATSEDDSDQETIESRVAYTTRALAPFIVPMINNLGALSSEDVAEFGQIGDDE